MPRAVAPSVGDNAPSKKAKSNHRTKLKLTPNQALLILRREQIFTKKLFFLEKPVIVNTFLSISTTKLTVAHKSRSRSL
jgi:hypothetical protein